jgi:hypothetical protein
MNKRTAQRSKNKGFTSSRIASRINESQAFESKLFPVAERVDSPKNKLFVVVARLNSSSAEFSRLQSGHFFRILPLISNQRWKKVLVWPLGRAAQVDMEPSSGRAFPASPKGDLQALLPMVAAQHQPGAGEDLLLIASRGIETPEEGGVRQNVKPAIAQHGEVVE